MKFSKTPYLFFAVFFLTTKIGLAFNIHYCGESIADISHIFEGKNGCKMEVVMTLSPCEKEMQKKGCCDDKVVVIQNTDQNPLVNTLQLSKQQFAAILNTAVFFQGVEFQPSDPVIEITCRNSSHSPPLYQLYCSYTFYA